MAAYVLAKEQIQQLPGIHVPGGSCAGGCGSVGTRLRPGPGLLWSGIPSKSEGIKAVAMEILHLYAFIGFNY